MQVSTLAVEWIEIKSMLSQVREMFVSTLAVEWIEILRYLSEELDRKGLHPRGGVD